MKDYFKELRKTLEDCSSGNRVESRRASFVLAASLKLRKTWVNDFWVGDERLQELRKTSWCLLVAERLLQRNVERRGAWWKFFLSWNRKTSLPMKDFYEIHVHRTQKDILIITRKTDLLQKDNK